jgi:predicted Zn-dependent protease
VSCVRQNRSVIGHDPRSPQRQRSALSSPSITLVLLVLWLSRTGLCAQVGAQNFDAESARATTAREAGRIGEALQAYREAVKARPNWDEGWWYLGTLNYDADHFADAIPALQRFVELDPKVGAGWAFLGLCEFETADYGASFTHLQKAQSLGFIEDPDVEKVAIYHLALLFNLRGDFEDSAHVLLKTFDPVHLPDQIKAALSLSLLRVPLLPSQVDPARDALLHAAGEIAALLAQQDIEGATRAFQGMLKDFRQTPYLHYAYGQVLVARAQYEEAEAQFRAEEQITPHNPISQIGLSELNLRRGQIDRAVTHARNAVRLDPDSHEAYRALAQSLQAAKQSPQAERAAAKAEQLANRPMRFDSEQAKFYALNHGTGGPGDPGPSDSVNARQATVSKGDGSAQPDFNAIAGQADAAREANQLAEAAELYQQSLQLRPGWQEGWRQLGTLLYMEQKYAESANALRHSVALEAKQADTWTLLGLCEFEAKDYKNALLHLKKGQALGFGGNAAAVRYARYHLAVLLNLNSEFDLATDLLIPEAHPGPLFEEIQFAMGLALLRIRVLPAEVDPPRRDLIVAAGHAAMLLSESRYDNAFPAFEKLLQQYPNTPFLRYAYGDALAATSEYDRAQTQLREEVRYNPDSPLVYIRLAAIALRLNDSTAALDSAKKAVSLARDSADAHYILGRSFLESGDVASAIAELETARGLAPGSPAVHFNLARAYAKAKRPEEAYKERAEFELLNAELSAQTARNDHFEEGARSVLDGAEPLAPK